MPRSRGGRGGLGILGILVVLGLAFFFGVDPRLLLDMMDGGGREPSVEAPRETDGEPIPDISRETFPDTEVPRRDADRPPPQPERPPIETRKAATDDEVKQFVAVVLKDTETVWHALFDQFDEQYREPKLVIFDNAVRSACGMGMSAMGPFYCPGDGKVYIDLAFFKDLKNRFRAPGDFAQAYVIAHEVGHHVQTLLGIAQQVQEAKAQMSERQANAVQVMMELQADCLAGVWAHNADEQENILEEGDIEEALGAASAIGDDRIQKQAQGYVVPDAFTHGTSEQRVRWFRRGFESGQMDDCDTFNADRL